MKEGKLACLPRLGGGGTMRMIMEEVGDGVGLNIYICRRLHGPYTLCGRFRGGMKIRNRQRKCFEREEGKSSTLKEKSKRTRMIRHGKKIKSL